MLNLLIKGLLWEYYTIVFQNAFILQDRVVGALAVFSLKLEVCFQVRFIFLMEEEVCQLLAAARSAFFLDLFICNKLGVVLQFIRCHLLVGLASKSSFLSL